MPSSVVETRPLESLVLAFTTPWSRFFRQPHNSHINKQMLVFYSLVHTGERGKATQEWLEGMACQPMLHIVPLNFFPSWGLGVSKKGLGGKWQHVCVFIVGYRAMNVYVCL